MVFHQLVKLTKLQNVHVIFTVIYLNNKTQNSSFMKLLWSVSTLRLSYFEVFVFVEGGDKTEEPEKREPNKYAKIQQQTWSIYLYM